MAAVKFNRSGRGRNKQVLRYPLKMFTAGTDYLQIDMLDYAPVARADGQETYTETVNDPDAIGPVTDKITMTKEVTKTRTKYSSYTKNPRDGFRRNSNKQPLGTILLPIPSNIQDGNSVNYTDDSMNSLIGAGLGAVEGIMKGVGTELSEGDFVGVGRVFGELAEGGLKASGIFLDIA